MEVPATMRGLVQLHDGLAATPGGPDIARLSDWVALRELPVPRPGPGQALVKVALAAVNPSDLHFIKGAYGRPRARGVPAGFEGTGTVVAGETPFLGQRVSFFAGHSGSWADYALADAASLVPLRPDLRDEDAAALLVNPLTAIAMFGIVREAGAGAFVLTAAGSQLGKLLIALGAEAGIAPLAVVRRAAQAAALGALGAAEVLVTADPGWREAFRTLSLARKPRILLDAVADQISADLFALMGNRARWIVYGRLSTEPPRLADLGQLIFMDKRIEGFWLTRWLAGRPAAEAAAAMAEVQARFAAGRWRTDIAAVVPLAEAPERLVAALALPDGKVLIRP